MTQHKAQTLPDQLIIFFVKVFRFKEGKIGHTNIVAIQNEIHVESFTLN